MQTTVEVTQKFLQAGNVMLIVEGKLCDAMAKPLKNHLRSPLQRIWSET